MSLSSSSTRSIKNNLGVSGERYDLVFWSLFAALVFLSLLPIWVGNVLPILDALAHEHLITIIHDYDRNPLFQAHYERVDAIVPYLSYYKMVDWLAYLGGVEWADRVVLSLSLALLPVSALHLLRSAGHSRWLVLGVFPWMLNADFFMGFLNYLMSLPLFFWILAAHLRFMKRPSWRGALLVMGLLVFMAITHYLLWAVAIVLLPLLGLTIGARYGWRKALLWPGREVLLCLPSVATLMPWFLSYFVLAKGVRSSDQAVNQGVTLLARLKQLYAGEHGTPLGNIHQLFDRLFNRFSEDSGQIKGPLDFLFHRPGELATTLWLLGLALWIYASLRHPRPDAGTPQAGLSEVSTLEPPSLGSLRGTTYLGWVLALVWAAYFILPQHLSRPIILYGVNFRLVEVLAILSVVSLPIRPLFPPRHVRRAAWVGVLALFLAAVIMPLATGGAFIMASTEYGSIREAYGVIPAGRNVLTLRGTRFSNYLREPVFSGIGQYYAISKGGYVPYSFANSSSKPMVIREGTAMPCPLWYDHYTFSMHAHGRFYDYLVVYRAQGERPGRWESSLRRWRLVYQRDHWRVFENPSPTSWPEPTPAELRRRAKASRLSLRLLSWAGLDALKSRPLELHELLRLLGLKAAAESLRLEKRSTPEAAPSRGRFPSQASRRAPLQENRASSPRRTREIIRVEGGSLPRALAVDEVLPFLPSAWSVDTAPALEVEGL